MGRRDEFVATGVVDSAIEVHRTLGGPGLLESAYEEALCFELHSRGLRVDRQRLMPIVYKGHVLDTSLRLDLLVDGRVVVECKAIGRWHSVFQAQALTYLRTLNMRLALVIDFGNELLKDGIHRVINSTSRHIRQQ